MLEGFLHRDPAFRAKGEALFHKVHCEGIGFRENVMQVDAFSERESAEVLSRSGRRNGIKVINRRCAQSVKDERQLMMIWAYRVCQGQIETKGSEKDANSPDRGRGACR